MTGTFRTDRKQSHGDEEVLEPVDDLSEQDLTFWQHFLELRSRLLSLMVAVAIGTVVAMAFAKDIYTWLAEPMLNSLPLSEEQLVFLDPVEPFLVYLKLSVVTSVFVTTPFGFYQFWAFVSPAIYRKQRKYLLGFVSASSLVFLLGAVFCFFIVMPAGLQTLMTFALQSEITLTPQVTMSAYLGLSIKLMLAFGLIFEMPIITVLLTRLGMITWRSLLVHWRAAVVIICIAAAILTPPDIVTQLLLAVPMLVLYGISVAMSWMVRIQYQANE